MDGRIGLFCDVGEKMSEYWETRFLIKEKGMVVLRGVYGALRLRVYVVRYVIAYMCLSSSRTHASAAFEV